MTVTGIDECRRRLPGSKCVHVTITVGIVLRYGSSCNNNQAVSRVRVPPGSSPIRPYVALHVQIGSALGLLQRKPKLFVISVVVAVPIGIRHQGVVNDFKFVEGACRDRCSLESIGCRSPYMRRKAEN